MKYKIMENEFIKLYSTFYKNNPPDWRRHPNWIVPTIPFIGHKYAETKPRFAIYASTEYLADHIPGKNKKWDELLKSSNRHRQSFDNWKKDRSSFFPSIHMQPVSDGGLLCAAIFILFKKYGIKYNNKSPEEFLEEIVAANVCKFTDENSFDYCPKTKTKRIFSLSYFEADLKVLKPEVVIIPRTISKHSEIYQLLKNILIDSNTVISVNQFSKQSIGQRRKFSVRALKLQTEIKINYPLLSKWVDEVTKSPRKRHYSIIEVYRYLSHIEAIL